MGKEFNIPTIIKVTDSLGNEYVEKEGINGTIFIHVIDPKDNSPKIFYLGEKLSVNLIIDPSFSEDSYSLVWHVKNGVEVLDGGKRVNIKITNELIGENVYISGKIITNNQWHKYYGYDQAVTICLKALPK